MAIWEREADRLSRDLIIRLWEHDYPHDMQAPQHDFALFLIDKALQRSGRGLADFALPPPTFKWQQELHPNRLIAAEMDWDRNELEREGVQMVKRLNAGQRTT